MKRFPFAADFVLTWCLSYNILKPGMEIVRARFNNNFIHQYGP